MKKEPNRICFINFGHKFELIWILEGYCNSKWKLEIEIEFQFAKGQPGQKLDVDYMDKWATTMDMATGLCPPWAVGLACKLGHVRAGKTGRKAEPGWNNHWPREADWALCSLGQGGGLLARCYMPRWGAVVASHAGGDGEDREGGGGFLTRKTRSTLPVQEGFGS
jgi:hypothetical protein